MGLNHSSSIVTNNLLLNLDFKNPKRFGSTLGTNLAQDQNYNASTWGTFPTYKTTGIDAPDGSKTAVRMTTIFRYATYTLTANVATITAVAHGLGAGQNHYFEFQSGTGITGFYNITYIDANTFSIPVVAADSTGNVKVYGRGGLRVSITPFTPNGTDTYTVSFWARLIRSTIVSGGSIFCDLNDGTPSGTYSSQLIQGQWVQIVVTGVPTATSKSFFDLLSDVFGDIVIDYWGLKIENQNSDNTPLPLMDTVGNYTCNLYRPQYATLSDSYVTFTRTASTPKWGGIITTTGTGSLTAANFLYNDHTWEIWFKIDDVNPGSYDVSEGLSTLAVYSGWHSGFMYNASTFRYSIWDSTITEYICASWSISSQISQGAWYQAVVVRSGTVFTPYLNGVPLGTGYSRTASGTGINTANTIFLGGVNKVLAGAGSYTYYAKNTVGNMKMYNRALTATEVTQNFNALRGRFGI